MRISNITKQSFGNLYQANNLLKKIASKKATKAFLQEYTDIKNIISANKLDKKKYIDINLCHSETDGFSAVVWPKNEFTPYAPNAKIFLKTTKEGIENFISWANDWDKAYSPKSLNAMKKLDELIANADWNKLIPKK